ncbi:MAG: hypothetical protein QM730_22285 [Anaerolineales bacterium]
MFKIEEKPQAKNVPYLPHPGAELIHYLFVLVPSTEVDMTVLTRKVWEMANAGAFRIQFLGLCSDSVDEPAMRRVLVSMSSMMNYGSMTSEVKVISTNDWADSLKSRVHEGDMVVYWDAPTVSSKRNSLHRLLRENLNVPLYIVPGSAKPQVTRAVLGRQVMAWIGFLAIVIGFFFLQVRIYRPANNWTMPLALFSTAAELWLIWVWHDWFK